ncbi:MAG: hypothetical protein GC192_21620 [Bacteroidetes bacterium]|nr:hypothetical protein [Bacteroidota bacterium]
MRKFLALAALFFLAKVAVLAQVSGKAVVDSASMYVGDQMRMRLELSVSKTVEIKPLDLSVVSADSVFEILSESKWDTLSTSVDKLRLQKNLLFIAWDSGYQSIPSIPIAYKYGGKNDTFYTRKITMKIDFPQVDTTLADIKPILREPLKIQDFIWYILGAVALVIIVLLVIFLNKRKVALPPPSVQVAPLLPHELALQQLDSLAQQRLWQKGEVKGYHSALTHIVREYLEKRYGIQALEQTTDEILAQLRQRDFDLSLSKKLGEVLQTADLVKFAKAEPTAEFHEKAMRVAREFILETKPTERQLMEMAASASHVAAGDNVQGPGFQPSFELAGFWSRFFARLIDILVIVVLILVTAVGLGFLFSSLGMNPSKIWIYLIYALEILAYSAIFEYRGGATLGKKICGIKVADTEGHPISFQTSCIRTACKYILSELLFSLGYLLFFFDKNYRQTLHDRLAGTIVIKRRPHQLAVFQNPNSTQSGNVQ